MAKSYLILIAALAIAAASCSTKPAVSASRPVRLTTTETLEITSGVKIAEKIHLPAGFLPIRGRPPMWLENGTEIGVVGTIGGNVIVLGFSGPRWQHSRILAAARGPGAAEQGRIVDLAASPNGMTLASAVQVAGRDRLDVILRDLIATGPGQPVTSFDGTYRLAAMQWINNATIAIELRPNPQPKLPRAVEPSELPPGAPAQSLAPRPSKGLQLIVVTGPGSVAPLNLKCPISTIQWSPGGRYGVAAGDADAPPAIIDRGRSKCTRYGSEPPVKVLGWSPVKHSEFLAVQPVPLAHSAGVFSFDIKHNRTRPVAISSGAAAFIETGAILAYGNQKLRWNMIERHPLIPVIAEIAQLHNSGAAQIDIKQLGFQTVPPMMLASTMAYTPDSDRAAIIAYAPALPVPMRKVLIYSLRTDGAFQIAYGPARGVVELSWSPGGTKLAILDGDQRGSRLTIVMPPG